MKSYAIRTAKKLSHDADSTLQDTLSFRNHIGNDLQRSSGLKAQLDSLNGSLSGLQDANKRLAENKSPEDMELERKVGSLKLQLEERTAQLQEESNSLKSLEETHAVLDEQLAILRQTGDKQMADISSDLQTYSRHLGVIIEKVETGFKLTFEDIGESVMLRSSNISTVSIEGPTTQMEMNLSDPLAICKLLLRARETLKI